MRAAQLIAILGLFVMTLWGDPPAWWLQRGVIKQGVEADDYALLNQGQLKQFALGAFLDLEGSLVGGAGLSFRGLIDQWTVLNGSGVRVSKVSEKTEDYATVNLGQLKAVAQVYYDRLIEVGVVGGYPWSGVGVDDYAFVNIGQAKAVFAVDLWALDAKSDTNGNGIPDWWERLTFGTLNDDPNADTDGDGVSDRDEYRAGTDPLDYYNGKEPILTVLSGDHQKGSPGAVLPNPMVVLVTDKNGVPLVYAPVTFVVMGSGSGSLTLDPSWLDGHKSMLMRTDSEGHASVFLLQPDGEEVFTEVDAVVSGKKAKVAMIAKTQVSLGIPYARSAFQNILSRSPPSFGVNLTWDPVPGAEAYHIRRRSISFYGTTDVFSGIESDTGNSIVVRLASARFEEFPGNVVIGNTHLLDESVDPAAYYSYQVQAIRAGNVGEYGNSIIAQRSGYVVVSIGSKSTYAAQNISVGFEQVAGNPEIVDNTDIVTGLPVNGGGKRIFVKSSNQTVSGDVQVYVKVGNVPPGSTCILKAFDVHNPAPASILGGVQTNSGNDNGGKMFTGSTYRAPHFVVNNVLIGDVVSNCKVDAGGVARLASGALPKLQITTYPSDNVRVAVSVFAPDGTMYDGQDISLLQVSDSTAPYYVMPDSVPMTDLKDLSLVIGDVGLIVGFFGGLSPTLTVARTLDAPVGLTAITTKLGITLSWNPVDGATSYKILRSNTAGNYAEFPGNEVTIPSFVYTGGEYGTTYHYVIQAKTNLNEASSYSSDVTGIMPRAMDSDGDGFTDYEEFLAGTNPNDKTDFPYRVIYSVPKTSEFGFPRDKAILLYLNKPLPAGLNLSPQLFLRAL